MEEGRRGRRSEKRKRSSLEIERPDREKGSDSRR